MQEELTKIREALPGDRSAILRLIKRALGTRWERAREKYEALLSKEKRDSAVRFYLALSAGRIVGCVGVKDLCLKIEERLIPAGCVFLCLESSCGDTLPSLVRYCESVFRRRGWRFIYLPPLPGIPELWEASYVGLRYRVWIDREVGRSNVEVRLGSREEAEEIFQLSLEEKSILMRRREEYDYLLTDKRTGRDLFVVIFSVKGEIKGYIVASRPLGSEFASESSPLCVNFYAGKRRDIFEGLPKAFSILGEPISFFLSPEDENWVGVFEKSFEVKKEKIPLPVKVLSPRVLWRDLTGPHSPWPPSWDLKILRLKDWAYFFFDRICQRPGARPPLPISIPGLDESILCL